MENKSVSLSESGSELLVVSLFISTFQPPISRVSRVRGRSSRRRSRSRSWLLVGTSLRGQQAFAHCNTSRLLTLCICACFATQFHGLSGVVANLPSIKILLCTCFLLRSSHVDQGDASRCLIYSDSWNELDNGWRYG